MQRTETLQERCKTLISATGWGDGNKRKLLLDELSNDPIPSVDIMECLLVQVADAGNMTLGMRIIQSDGGALATEFIKLLSTLLERNKGLHQSIFLLLTLTDNLGENLGIKLATSTPDLFPNFLALLGNLAKCGTSLTEMYKSIFLHRTNSCQTSIGMRLARNGSSTIVIGYMQYLKKLVHEKKQECATLVRQEMMLQDSSGRTVGMDIARHQSTYPTQHYISLLNALLKAKIAVKFILDTLLLRAERGSYSFASYLKNAESIKFYSQLIVNLLSFGASADDIYDSLLDHGPKLGDVDHNIVYRLIMKLVDAKISNVKLSKLITSYVKQDVIVRAKCDMRRNAPQNFYKLLCIDFVPRDGDVPSWAPTMLTYLTKLPEDQRNVAIINIQNINNSLNWYFKDDTKLSKEFLRKVDAFVGSLQIQEDENLSKTDSPVKPVEEPVQSEASTVFAPPQFSQIPPPLPPPYYFPVSEVSSAMPAYPLSVPTYVPASSYYYPFQPVEYYNPPEYQAAAPPLPENPPSSLMVTSQQGPLIDLDFPPTQQVPQPPLYSHHAAFYTHPYTGESAGHSNTSTNTHDSLYRPT